MILRNLFVILLYMGISLSAESLEVRVRVLEKPGDSPLSGIEVLVLEAGLRTKTSKEGRGVLSFGSSGFYTFKLVSQGSVKTYRKEVSYKGQELIFFLENSESSGIVVLGEKEKQKVSRYSLVQDEIKRLPGVGGDSLKAIQTLPGVVIGLPIGLTPSFLNNASGNLLTGNPYTNSERGDFSLRGGGTRNNQFYFDGFPLPYVFHLGNQSSVINNNAIRSFEILTGGFSARQGYATGGIISIEGTDKIERKKAIVNTNILFSDAYLQVPLSGSLSFYGGARKNYPNLIYLKAYPQAIPEDAKYADYSDFQFKFFYDPNPNHRITFQTFGSADLQSYTRAVAEFESSENKDPRPPIGLNRRFRTDGARYIYKTGKFRNTLSYSSAEFRESYEVNIQNPLTAETIFGFNNFTLDRLLFFDNRLEFDLLEDFIKLEAGVQTRNRRIDLKADGLRSTSNQFLNLFDDLVSSSPALRSVFDGDRVVLQESAAYGELEIKKNGFKLNPGLRLDSYRQSGESNLQPRFNAAYSLSGLKTTFLGSSGTHFNTPTLVQQSSKVAGNPNLFMERAEHNALGILQEFAKYWSIKIELFRNIYSNIIVNDSFVAEPYSPNIEARTLLRKPEELERNPFITKNLNYSNSGYGTSEGVEIFLRKERDPTRSEGFYGWLSYTNSITKRINNQARLTTDERRERDLRNGARKLLYQTRSGTNYINYYDDNEFEVIYNNDKLEYYDLDRTHVINLVFGYKWPKDWQVGARFRYFSGTPFTPIISSSRATAAAGGGAFTLNFPNYSENYNSDRLPPYHQLDFRIDKFLPYEWGYMNFYIDFINLYGRRNTIGKNFSNFEPYDRYKNPGPVFDTVNSPYVQTVRPGGNLVFLPLINFGLEVKF